MGSEGSNIMFRVNEDIQMISLISKERRDTSSGTRSIVVRELCKWQELRPVILLVVTIYTKVLLEYLVHVLRLSIIFGIVTLSYMFKVVHV